MYTTVHNIAHEPYYIRTRPLLRPTTVNQYIIILIYNYLLLLTNIKYY